MIIGCAIISHDGFIADESGSMARLAHDADFAALQKRLNDAPGIGVMGRVTHDLHENRRQRQRYVLSHAKRRDTATETFFQNEADLLDKIASQPDQTHYILGGGALYALFGENNLYDEFHLSVRTDIDLGSGRSLNFTHGFETNSQLMAQWQLVLADQETAAVYPGLHMLRYHK